MDPYDLLRIARQLASGAIGAGRGRPRQAELRRAVSAAYYAMFHALARCTANTLVGTASSNRSQAAWRQTYRALEHGHARNQCGRQAIMSRFPSEIQSFGETFVIRQWHRHDADYDPDVRFSRSFVMQIIDETEAAITDFESVQARDRRAFSIYVLLRTRGI